MKKYLNFIFLSLCIFLMFGLVACSKNEKPIQDTKTYSVSCEKSDYYSYGGTVNSTSGITANFTITSNFSAYEILGCTYNGNDCTFVSETENGKSYSFTMPSSNVEIKVLGSWKDTEVSGYNNFLSFDSNNVYTVKSAIDEADYNNDRYFGSPLIITYVTNASFMTIADVTVFSTNEDILPSTALVQENTQKSSSNEIIGGVIIIDRSKAKIGETQLVIRVKNGNSMGYDGLIVATIHFTK